MLNIIMRNNSSEILFTYYTPYDINLQHANYTCRFYEHFFVLVNDVMIIQVITLASLLVSGISSESANCHMSIRY